MKIDVLDRITQLRMQKNWTEYELAKASDLPQSSVSSWYAKGMLPSLTSLMKICAGLGITPSQFFCEDGKAVALTEAQKNLLCKYAALSIAQREKLDIFLDGMLTR